MPLHTPVVLVLVLVDDEVLAVVELVVNDKVVVVVDVVVAVEVEVVVMELTLVLVDDVVDVEVAVEVEVDVVVLAMHAPHKTGHLCLTVLTSSGGLGGKHRARKSTAHSCLSC